MSAPVKHAAMLDGGTWCGEPYDETTCTIDPERCTCVKCLAAMTDFGERAQRRLRRVTAAAIGPDCVVEWDPAHGPPRRAVVHRIEAGRVYIRWPRRPTVRHPLPYTETWFDANEVHLLRLVPP